MREWDRAKAIAAFEAFQLSGTNAALAVYWLSLWDGNRPPRRGDFNPARVRDLLPAIALTEVRSNDDPVCRLSGRYIDMALGAPMRGVNMLTLAGGAEQRTLRRARLCALVDGGVALAKTHYRTEAHVTAVAETIQLPFHGMLEDGSRQILMHTNWRPAPADYRVRTRRPNAGFPDAYCALPLR
ncbi:MAG TPA: PAS domain-containing protein [Rhizomicrobium sp.]|nr:PAS domain-containing protein [Rhizomicrobium sp.]